MENRGNNKEIRCLRCNKLLAMHNPYKSKFELKCLRCGEISFVLTRGDYLIFITDAEGKILYVNSHVKKLTGYSAKEVLGKTPSIWGKQMKPEFYRKLWKNILVKKRGVSVTLTNRRKNGSLYKVREDISPILNSKGKVESFLAIQKLI